MADRNDSEGVVRAIDAAVDRAMEAVRVIEDIFRFLRDAAGATEELKRFRHEFGTLTKNFDWRERLRCRETQGDVGTMITAEGEYHRGSLTEIFAANFCRLQESLRSIEEMSKLIRPDLSPQFEQLRYRSYIIEKTLFPLLEKKTFSDLRLKRRNRLSEASLYVSLDTSFSPAKLEEVFLSKVDIAELRDRTVSDQTILETALRWRALTQKIGDLSPLLIMNGRADLALLAGFDGVHVEQKDVSPDQCRRIFGPDLVIGRSVHCGSNAEQALGEDLDYLTVDPVFSSKTKPMPWFRLSLSACPSETESKYNEDADELRKISTVDKVKSLTGLDLLGKIVNNKDILTEAEVKNFSLAAVFADEGITEANIEQIV